MKHIRRKITVSVLGTMLFVFAVLLATVNIFIPEYLTSEARKAILLEDERKDPIPLAETMDDTEEHFLTSSVRYLEVEEVLTESEHLSKSEYQLRKYCQEEKPAADAFHTLKTGGSRFVFRITHVEADEYEDAYSYILYVDVGAVMQYSAYLNAVFFAVLAALSVLVCLFGWKLGGCVEKAHESQKWFFSECVARAENADDGCSGLCGGHPHRSFGSGRSIRGDSGRGGTDVRFGRRAARALPIGVGTSQCGVPFDGCP